MHATLLFNGEPNATLNNTLVGDGSPSPSRWSE
jgi:hypothetical protein